MGWYCPVEKRECDRDLQKNGPCLNCPWPSRIQLCNKCGEQHLDPTATCPYDNHRVPVKPQPTMTDDDSLNVACYKLGYDVGFNIGLDAAIKQVKHFAYVSGLVDEGMLIAAINACRVIK